MEELHDSGPASFGKSRRQKADMMGMPIGRYILDEMLEGESRLSDGRAGEESMVEVGMV
jgi:hypothetical protein